MILSIILVKYKSKKNMLFNDPVKYQKLILSLEKLKKYEKLLNKNKCLELIAYKEILKKHFF